MKIRTTVIKGITDIFKEDRKNIFYLLYYSTIEAILVLSIPLTTSFIINSILAHADISIIVLAIIVIIVFLLTTSLQIMKEYIIEKFQQKIFLTTSIKVAQMATNFKKSSYETKKLIDKYMNYFFDIGAIQKFFPVLLLDGSGLIVKIIASLLLLLAFDPILFGLGFFFFVFFALIIVVLGINGPRYAIERSDAKHSSIYFIQNIPFDERVDEETYKELDSQLSAYIDARVKSFRVIISQLSLTFFTEGAIFSAFLILGGNLVITGVLPVGEFIAAEIVVVSMTSAIKSFIKQIDYVYDMIEGFYKVDKLATLLGEHKNG
ncbi:ABC transporter ATP-binding protein [Sulfurimonas sp. SWIR-19]|uniref:ABC transporter ATP-binding protein n=1 Tax=Sulfurimonas sp. SWIR-19 TaxID=2878390 RepID=UPI001CF10C27|nr:ABC transporter ATP-binding protein [Sulfurimonas sp. SWIR-19]UCN00882.1 ABC transporter ATP-binding protein [Sulfurimonas sp. SWIR-19]